MLNLSFHYKFKKVIILLDLNSRLLTSSNSFILTFCSQLFLNQILMLFFLLLEATEQGKDLDSFQIENILLARRGGSPEIEHFRRPRQADCLSSGVPDQPGPWRNPISTKEKTILLIYNEKINLHFLLRSLEDLFFCCKASVHILLPCLYALKI